MYNAAKERVSQQAWVSPAIAICGVVFQVVTWLIMFSFLGSPDTQSNSWIDVVLLAMTIPWFTIPLVSIVGIYAGVTYQRHNKFSFLASAGVILNLLWLVLFVMVVVIGLVLGITV